MFKRWPVFYLLCCLAGVSVGVGGLCLFGTSEPNERKAMFLRGFGILMVIVYTWWIIVFVVRWVRGTWARHCDERFAELDAL